MISGKNSWLIVALTLAVFTSVEILADLYSITWLLYSSKPLLLIVLIRWYTLAVSPIKGEFKYILFGLIFSLFGDVFLMIREVDLFIPGLVSFLTAHIFYILNFRKTISLSERKSTSGYLLSTSIVFLSFIGLFLGFLLPYIVNNEETSVLLIPVVVYAIVITLMGFLAAQRRAHVGLTSFRYILMGSIFFILSDCILATNKFAVSIDYSTIWVMTTYVTAQYFIVVGSIVHFQKLKTKLPTD